MIDSTDPWKALLRAAVATVQMAKRLERVRLCQKTAREFAWWETDRLERTLTDDELRDAARRAALFVDEVFSRTGGIPEMPKQEVISEAEIDRLLREGLS